MTDLSVTQYNPYNMYQNFRYYPAFRGATVPQNNYNSVPQMTQQPDTVSFSANGQIQNEKQGLSNGAKLGIGAGIVLGLGALAYVLTRGKAGSKQVQQLAEHIDFKEAKTFEEAKKYAKDKLGVIYYDVNDLEMANFINEWLTTIRNKCKSIDKTSYPKIIANMKEKQITAPFCMTSSAKYNKNIEGHILGVNMSTFNNFDKFIEEAIGTGSVLSKNKNGKYIIIDDAYKTDFITNVIERVNNYSNNLSLKNKLKLMSDMKSIQDGKMVNGKWKEKPISIYQTLNHELGHLRHQYLAKDYELMKKADEFILQGKPVSDITKEFLNTPTIQETAGKVSVYAQESPLEFVAETFAGLRDGIKFDDDVMALYKKYNGPMV